MKLSFKKDYYAILLQNRQIWPRRCGEESRDFFISCQGLLNIRGPGQYCATLIFNKPWQEMKKSRDSSPHRRGQNCRFCSNIA